MNLKPLILACAIGLYAAGSMAATVTAVRSWRAPDNTRLVLDLSDKVRYRQISANARQVIIELEDTDVTVATPSLPSRVGLVQNVQFQRDGNKQLLIINLSDEVKPHVFDLPANDKYSPRLVIDLFDKITLQPVTTAEEEVVSNDGNNGRPVIVVVDAGHGGEDSGAIGANGHYEKNVTLAIARKLVATLRKADGFKAYLTRDDDYFIPLQDRRKIARNRYKADIFVSIHADSSPSPLARGASVFALSRKGANTATSRFAQALAEQENKSDLIGGVDADAGRDSQLTNILADMVVEGSLTQSLHMGGRILDELSEIGQLHTRHIEQAAFAVLKEPGMISVLVETGFISNPDEEVKLTDPDSQQRIAQSVFNGVRSFVQKYPLSKTYFAWGKEQRSGKQKARALQAVVTAPDIRPVVMTPDKLIDKPVIVNTAPVVEPVKTPVVKEPVKELPVVKDEPRKTAEPVKAVTAPAVDGMAALIAKPVAADKPADKTPVIEPKIVIVATPLPPREIKADVAKPEKKTEPVVSKPVVTATLPGSLDEFMAGVPKPAAKTTAPANNGKPVVKAVETHVEAKVSNVSSKPVEKAAAVADKVKADAKTDSKKAVTKADKHTVVAGDSLSGIAAHYNVSVDDLKAWNKLKTDNAMLGMTLRLKAPDNKDNESKDKNAVDTAKAVKPVKTADKADNQPEKALPAAKTGKPLADSVSLVKDKSKTADKTETAEVKARTHKVKAGDSLSSIATKYGVPAKAIRDLNKLKDDNVQLDTTLKIPAP